MEEVLTGMLADRGGGGQGSQDEGKQQLTGDKADASKNNQKELSAVLR